MQYKLRDCPPDSRYFISHKVIISMAQQNFNDRLIELLKTNPDFIDESSKLLPAAVKDSAWKLDHNLIRLLLTDAV